MKIIPLIKKAGKALGSEYKLAQALGVNQNYLSAWKSGIRPCTPQDRARLAYFAGMDALEELVSATIETNKGKTRGEQINEILSPLLAQYIANRSL